MYQCPYCLEPIDVDIDEDLVYMEGRVYHNSCLETLTETD